ncbi:hypothetical protein [Streptomyces collinus]|uniref:hypothetical protein n=1 Tax=Streptomyces collinus TaxID=42684 RepID=UPI0037FFAA4C
MFTAVFQGAIAEAAKRAWWTCRWSAWTRPQSGPAGMIVETEILDVLEKAAADKGAPARNKTGSWTRSGKNDDA